MDFLSFRVKLAEEITKKLVKIIEIRAPKIASKKQNHRFEGYQRITCRNSGCENKTKKKDAWIVMARLYVENASRIHTIPLKNNYFNSIFIL